MTEAIYSRGVVRELGIWTPFLYVGRYGPNVDADRVVVFGLYAAAYRHGFDYLEAIEAEDLQQIVDIYDQNMAELNNDEQMLVIEVSARRYLNGIDKEIKDAKLATLANKIAVEKQETDAKIDALTSDHAELETRTAEIELSKEKIANRIKEIEGKIALEEVDYAYVEAEISGKELEVAKTELAITEAALKGLNVQLAISEAALDLVELDAKKAEYGADLAMLDSKIAGTELEQLKLDADQEEYDAAGYAITEIEAAKLVQIDSKSDIIKLDTTNTEAEQEKAADIESAILDEQTARTTALTQSIENQEKDALQRRDLSIKDDTLDKRISADRKVSDETIAEDRTRIPQARERAAETTADAAIDAAEKLAAADIVTTLTHSIGRAS